MQTLASALARVVRRRPPPELSYFDPRDPFDPVCELIADLQSAPPTAPLEAVGASLRETLDLLPPPPTDGLPDAAAAERRDLLRRLEVLDEQLKACHTRDTLAAARPPDCWCLGLGGRDPVATFAFLPDCQDVAWTQGQAVYRETCPYCPEGLAAEARRLAAVQYAETVGKLDTHERLLGHCEVPELYRRCTLENFPVTAESRPAWETVVAWNDRLARNLPGKRGAWIWGEKLGAGKTSLACALLGKWSERNPGHRGLFIITVDLLDAIRSSYETGVSRKRLMEDATERPFAVIDDLGAEIDTPWVAERLFSLVNGRHNAQLPTVFTSNLGPEELHEQLGQGTEWQRRQSERIVARLAEMCEVIHLNGPDLREPEVRARLGLPPQPGAPAQALTLPF